MDNLYLFEAGATKTALMYQTAGQKHEEMLPGFNPNIDYAPFEIAVQEGINLPSSANVVVYGSGLSNPRNIQIVEQIFGARTIDKLRIYDDIIGAARAAFGEHEGIVSIMGTGGLAAYYNGNKIQGRRGGYGYLVDDLGGGFNLGQEVLAAWLNGDLNDEQVNVLESETGLDARGYLGKIYETKNPKLIASMSKLIAPFKEQENVSTLIRDYFNRFISKNVKPLCEEYDVSSFSVVGSVGTSFYTDLREVAKDQKLQLDQCIQSPISRLFDYHSS